MLFKCIIYQVEEDSKHLHGCRSGRLVGRKPPVQEPGSGERNVPGVVRSEVYQQHKQRLC